MITTKRTAFVASHFNIWFAVEHALPCDRRIVVVQAKTNMIAPHDRMTMQAYHDGCTGFRAMTRHAIEMWGVRITHWRDLRDDDFMPIEDE